MPQETKRRTTVTVRIDRQAAAEIAYVLNAVLSDLAPNDADGAQAIERVRNAAAEIAQAATSQKGAQ